MRRFDIITEVEARMVPSGETVVLTKGGHVTPLAADTLRERRVTIVSEDHVAPDDADLAPTAEIRTVALGCDHAGVALRRMLSAWLKGRGVRVIDHGVDSTEAVDYPDIAALVGSSVAGREADAGIVIDGAGIGSAIAANKLHGIRAAMATSPLLARYSRAHNGANVLALGATLVTEAEAREIVETWVSTPMREPRYIRRLSKIRALERQAVGRRDFGRQR